jgi:hypothetical protein
MSNEEYQVLKFVNTLDDVNTIVQQHQVSKYRTSNLSNQTKYSYRCSHYRKYPLCRYEIQVYVPDDNPSSIKLTFKNSHYHDYRNSTSRLPSPVRESVAKYVKCNLTQSQIKATIAMDYPQASLSTEQLTNLITYYRRQKNPEIFSVYDFNQWCINHKYDDNSLHTTFVPYYSINSVNDIFVFFTTKQLIQQIQLTTLLQVDATYKLTWNNLPLLVFGASDADRHFHPFGIALVSSDEDSTCFHQLFNQLQSLSTQQFNRQYVVNYIMADGASGKLINKLFVIK